MAKSKGRKNRMDRRMVRGVHLDSYPLRRLAGAGKDDRRHRRLRIGRACSGTCFRDCSMETSDDTMLEAHATTVCDGRRFGCVGRVVIRGRRTNGPDLVVGVVGHPTLDSLRYCGTSSME
jgi:hypothetical protein